MITQSGFVPGLHNQPTLVPMTTNPAGLWHGRPVSATTCCQPVIASCYMPYRFFPLPDELRGIQYANVVQASSLTGEISPEEPEEPEEPEDMDTIETSIHTGGLSEKPQEAKIDEGYETLSYSAESVTESPLTKPDTCNEVPMFATASKTGDSAQDQQITMNTESCQTETCASAPLPQQVKHQLTVILEQLSEGLPAGKLAEDIKQQLEVELSTPASTLSLTLQKESQNDDSRMPVANIIRTRLLEMVALRTEQRRQASLEKIEEEVAQWVENNGGRTPRPHLPWTVEYEDDDPMDPCVMNRLRFPFAYDDTWDTPPPKKQPKVTHAYSRPGPDYQPEKEMDRRANDPFIQWTKHTLIERARAEDRRIEQAWRSIRRAAYHRSLQDPNVLDRRYGIQPD